MPKATGPRPTNRRSRTKVPRGAWVHAYLHRKEGDAGNAAYWYDRADQTAAHGPLADEWLAIANALLAS